MSSGHIYYCLVILFYFILSVVIKSSNFDKNVKFCVKRKISSHRFISGLRAFSANKKLLCLKATALLTIIDRGIFFPLFHKCAHTLSLLGRVLTCFVCHSGMS